MNIEAREDTTAARTPPQTLRYQPGYDCPLPNDALNELLSRRPSQPPVRALQRPPTAWRRVLHLLAFLAVPVVLIALLGAILTGLHDKSATQPSTPVQAPSVQPTPAAQTPVVQPTSAVLPPGWNADGTAQGRAGTIPEVRRAELVPAPRAQLVRLPNFTLIAPEHIDQTHTITMPYGTEVSATLRGFLGFRPLVL